ncbi:MAG: iron-sulfur cluster assembly scaffold protein [Proteobacteria bacterium]|nr:iron-sulfur cluster assembly scaffold protein [Pseudomonadota bacterium]
MIQDLYQKDLLRYAADAVAEGPLPDADGEATVDNPTCGDRITMQVKMADGKITALGHESRSCVLCQAAASVIGENAVGSSLADLSTLRGQVEQLLQTGDGQFEEAWQKLKSFQAVATHKSRHTCVLLPFDALIEALSKSTVNA